MRYRDIRTDLLPGKRRAHEEDDIQRALWQHIVLFKHPDAIAYAVPNGEKRSQAVARRLKAAGVVAGVYDLAGSVPGGMAWHLELKTPDGRLSPAQVDFGALCERNGCLHTVCYSLDDALKWLRVIGVLLPE